MGFLLLWLSMEANLVENKFDWILDTKATLLFKSGVFFVSKIKSIASMRSWVTLLQQGH